MLAFSVWKCVLQLFSSYKLAKFDIFWRKNIGTKVACKMLMKLTTEQSISSMFYARVFCMRVVFRQLFSSLNRKNKFVILAPKFRTKNVRVKRWWNCLQNNQLIRRKENRRKNSRFSEFEKILFRNFLKMLFFQLFFL